MERWVKNQNARRMHKIGFRFVMFEKKKVTRGDGVGLEYLMEKPESKLIKPQKVKNADRQDKDRKSA